MVASASASASAAAAGSRGDRESRREGAAARISFARDGRGSIAPRLESPAAGAGGRGEEVWPRRPSRRFYVGTDHWRRSPRRGGPRIHASLERNRCSWAHAPKPLLAGAKGRLTFFLYPEDCRYSPSPADGPLGPTAAAYTTPRGLAQSESCLQRASSYVRRRDSRLFPTPRNREILTICNSSSFLKLPVSP
jgi:hypothetical protein